MNKYFLRLIIPAVVALLIAGPGCSGPGQATKKTAVNPAIDMPASLEEKQLNSVDFFARGSIPSSWTVEIDFGNLIRFKALDGTEVNSSAVEPVFDEITKSTSFSSKATDGNIIIKALSEQCKDAVSGEQYAKKVEVNINGKIYQGCGQYLFDKRISGSWQLETVNNQQVLAADFAKAVPTLRFGLDDAKLSGHDGCNNFTGSFELLGNKIRFTPIASTKMACSSKSNFQLLPLISSKTVDYYFKDEKLYLYLEDDSIIIFKKSGS